MLMKLSWMFKMEEKDCKFCKPNERTLIKEFNNWYASLNPNQYYLGRHSIVLNRNLEDFTEINKEEQDELFDIMRVSKKVLTDLFDVNMFNYYIAGNIVPHLHMHIIPRYNHEVEFEGFTFKDKLWGKNHSFYPRDFKIDDDLFNKIREKLTSKF